MSTPPVPPGRDDVEDDPTGIRALLGSLPDPGPMPEDLVARIQASISAEQSARGFDPGGQEHDHTVVPLPTRRGWGWKQLGLAAAAVAALAVGVPALAGGGPGGVTAFLSGDSSSGSAASRAETSASPSTTAPTASPGIAVGERAPGATGPVTLVGTGTAYTAAALVSQVRSSREHATSPAKGGPARPAGPAESETGLRSCLTTLGVEAWMPVWADVASYQGRAAVVAVVSSDTGQQVYAVAPECDRTHPLLLSGPVPLP